MELHKVVLRETHSPTLLQELILNHLSPFSLVADLLLKLIDSLLVSLAVNL